MKDDTEMHHGKSCWKHSASKRSKDASPRSKFSSQPIAELCPSPRGSAQTCSPGVVHLADIPLPFGLPEFFSAPDKHLVLAGVELKMLRNDCMEAHRDSFLGAQRAGGKPQRRHRLDLVCLPLHNPVHVCVHTHVHAHTHISTQDPRFSAVR